MRAYLALPRPRPWALAGVGDVDGHAHLLPGRGAAVDRQDAALQRVAVPEGEQLRDDLVGLARDVAELGAAALDPCLLYTSPSPRDRG